jgi:hypothetical protein
MLVLKVLKAQDLTLVYILITNKGVYANQNYLFCGENLRNNIDL